MSQITTHVLDTSRGLPVNALPVALYYSTSDTKADFNSESWQLLTSGETNEQGRISDWLQQGQVLHNGLYRVRFETKRYFDRLQEQSFFPFVEITFLLSSTEHYHIPLLLSAYGYSTYRGS